MRDPRIARGEPQTWPGRVNPRVEQRTLVRVFQIDLPCPTCKGRGNLTKTDAVRDGMTLHICSGENCRDKWLIAGEPYPKRVEELDRDVMLMRG